MNRAGNTIGSHQSTRDWVAAQVIHAEETTNLMLHLAGILGNNLTTQALNGVTYPEPGAAAEQRENARKAIR